MMQVLKDLLPKQLPAALILAIVAVGLIAMPASAGPRDDPDLRGRPHEPIFTLPHLVLQPWSTPPRIFLHTVQEGGEDDDSGIRAPGITRPIDDVFTTLDDLPLITDSLFDIPPSTFDTFRVTTPDPPALQLDPGFDIFGSTDQTIDTPPAGTIPGPGAWPLIALALVRGRRRRR